MSDKNKLYLKRKRQSSSENIEKRPRLKGEQISRDPEHGELPIPSGNLRAPKRVSGSKGRECDSPCYQILFPSYIRLFAHLLARLFKRRAAKN